MMRSADSKGKKILKFKSNTLSELEKLTADEPAFMELFKNSNDLHHIKNNSFQSGIILTEDEVFSVVKLADKWYIPNGISVNDFLISFFGNELARKIFFCTKKAIAIVRNANTFDEIRHLNKPFRITLKG